MYNYSPFNLKLVTSKCIFSWHECNVFTKSLKAVFHSLNNNFSFILFFMCVRIIITITHRINSTLASFHETLLLMSYFLLLHYTPEFHLHKCKPQNEWKLFKIEHGIFQNGWFPTSQLLVCVKLTITFLLLSKLISELWTLCTKNFLILMQLFLQL